MSSQTLKQLKDFAKENKIKGYSKMKKEELQKAISELKKNETSIGKCGALIFENDSLVKCGMRTDNKYCSFHSERYKFEVEECTICLESISTTSEMPLACGHWFHKECLKPTDIHSCPYCRSCMDKSDIEYIFGKKHTEKEKYSLNDIIEYNEFVNGESNQEIENEEECECDLCRTRNGRIELSLYETDILTDLLLDLIEYKINTYNESRNVSKRDINNMIINIFESNENQIALFRLSRINNIRSKLNKAKSLYRPVFNFINVAYYSDMRLIFTVIDNLKNIYLYY